MSHPENIVHIPLPVPCAHFDAPPVPEVVLRPESFPPPSIVEFPAPIVVEGPCVGSDGGDFPHVPPIDFSYGDASSARWVAPVAGRVVEVRVDIDTEFNGTGASVTVGTLADPAVIMPAAKNNPREVAMYSATTEVFLAAGTALWLGIFPGSGASQGAGTLHVTFVPEN